MSEAIWEFTIDQWIGFTVIIIGIITLLYMIWWNSRKERLKETEKKIEKQQKQVSKDNIGDTIQMGKYEKVTIDKPMNKTNNVTQLIFNDLKNYKKTIDNDIDDDDDYYDDDDNDDIDNSIDDDKKPSNEPIKIDVFLPPKDSKTISLGKLRRGDIVNGFISETYGNNFSYFIIDKRNKSAFEWTKRIPPKSVCRRKNKKKYNIKCEIKIDDEYFILLTHQATVKGRDVRGEIKITS